MLDAFCAHYGHESICRLRGVEQLSVRDRQIFRACLFTILEDAAQPLEQALLRAEVGDG